MIGVTLIIKERTDKSPALPGIEIHKILSLADIVILEAGMESGSTSVAFHMTDNEGRHYIIETSAKIMLFFSGALQGAEIKFSENKTKLQ